ncbi:TetR family transcriptional regulator [Streptacidiphilus sp. N1-3]|uniref:TetR family transcriptional regulator n=1 Tax=Streptacidiphilus alkalitolerans TaxID=3342712 RepID=A0ABV6X6U5_9ACTN
MTEQVKWARHREETRELILRTALRLFAEHGYGRTTVRTIADECGLTERTVYRYFARKEDLVRAERDKTVAVLLGLVRSQPGDTRPLTAVQDALHGLREVDPEGFMGLLHDAPGARTRVPGSPGQDLFEEYAAALAVVIQERLTTEDPVLRGAQARVIGQVAAALTRCACRSSAVLSQGERSADALVGLLDEAFASIQLA